VQQTQPPLWSSLDALPAPAAGLHRYLLVNQAALKGERTLLARLSRLERRPLFGLGDDSCLDGATPFVIRIDFSVNFRSILRDLANAACYACALSQIDTSLEIGQFADALTRRSEVLLPDGMSMLLRFFDTRILMPLLDVLTDDQRIAFLSCARDWWYADREGAMVPSLCPTWAGADTFAPPLKLSAGQERAMIDASEADAVIDFVGSRGRHPLFDAPYPQRYPIVRALIDRAHHWGLENIPDLAAFVTVALSTSSDFDMLPPWSELLPQVKAKGLTFRAALDQVRNKEGR